MSPFDEFLVVLYSPYQQVDIIKVKEPECRIANMPALVVWKTMEVYYRDKQNNSCYFIFDVLV